MKKGFALLGIGLFQITLVALGHQYPIVTLLGVMLGSGLFWWVVGATRLHARFFCLIAIAGATAEIIAIAGGAWTYSYPFILGIPIWLPFLWGSAGLAIIGIYQLLSRRG